jgi:hypothetical protein
MFFSMYSTCNYCGILIKFIFFSTVLEKSLNVKVYWNCSVLSWQILLIVGRELIPCKAVFPNRWAAAQYRALASIIPGRER